MASNRTINIGFKFEKGADGLRELIIDAQSLRRAMNATVTESDKLNKSFINVSASARVFKAIDESVSQLGNAITSITSESNSFSAAMKAANTMADKGAEGFELMKDQVTELGKRIPKVREELANGLYQVVSNGVPEDNWISFLETSARSSVGGMADLGTAVTVTSTIIKNYGLEWSKAKDIQDKIQLTAKNGVTSFEQLAASLPKVTGNASTLGVEIDELMASFATLTGVSGNTSEVATQLAAIFTALVKPSSEAGKMAEAMGIQFDAAAIKAAGGFRNFITQLKQDVSAYASATGTLEQEIYGRLFGSAEAVRALIPLTGELADKFSQNVDAMKGSAGTMDAAFSEMASTGAAKSQLLKNRWAEVTDAIASATSWMLPYLDFSSGVLSSTMSILTLRKTIVGLNLTTRVGAVFTKGFSASLTMLGVSAQTSAKAVRLLGASLKMLMATTGIGLAIWGITEAVIALTGASEDSATAAQKEAMAYDVKRRSLEMATEAAEEEASVRSKTSAQLSLDISRLKEFNGSKEDEKKIVGEMNSVYGKTMGYFSSVASWYEALIKNSKAYCEQMVAEAKARKLADQVAEMELQRTRIARNADGSARMYSTKRERITRDVLNENGEKTGKWEYAWSESDYDKAKKQVDDLTASIANLKKEMARSVKTAATISMPVMGAKEDPYKPEPADNAKKKKAKGSKTEVSPAPEGSIAAYEKQMADIRKKIEYTVDPEALYKLEQERLSIQRKIKALEMPVKLAASSQEIQERLGKVKPLALDEKVNMEGLESQLQSLPKILTPAEKLQQELQGISSAATAAGQAFQGMGEAFEIPALDVMGMIAGAIATMIQGYAMASSQAGMLGPWAWLGFGLTGLAQLTAMISQVKNLTKFADGGIVSGPTMALVGEYAGASRNPEVIAPLDRLQSIIGDGAGGVQVVIPDVRIKGSDLLISFGNARRVAGKTGRRPAGI